MFETFLASMRIHVQADAGWQHVPDLLNPPNPFLSFEVPGDPRSEPRNLDAPWRVRFLCYEDLPIADNYRDLIICINPVARWDNPQEHGHFVVVFFCEGSFEKIICYQGHMIHHYEPSQADMGRRNHYGIFATWDLSKKGPCPFCSKARPHTCKTPKKFLLSRLAQWLRQLFP